MMIKITKALLVIMLMMVVAGCNKPDGPSNGGESGGNDVSEGLLKGKFTINENGDQVRFSQGNLQYQASTNTWRFAESQYDLLNTAEDMTCIDDYGHKYADVSLLYSSTSNDWIDLFGWGTSGYEHGAVCYQPWSTNNRDYHYYAYGSSSCNLYDQTGEADWGYNSICNGGKMVNTWRTLAVDEWEYILFTRSTSSGIRFVKADVNGINGLILLPDDWDANTFVLYGINNTPYDVSFSNNVISASRWEILENAGAVFLPAAGDREKTKAVFIGYCGVYWSSTNSSYDHYQHGAGANQAYCMVFVDYFNNEPYPATVFINGGSFSYGASVRLVREVE